MLKILNISQIRALDAYTIENEPIPSIDLMEHACRGVVTWITEKFDATKKVGVICGPGNNGGDGLGIARLLA
jgi:NAD(P)H-hydrate epimerase